MSENESIIHETGSYFLKIDLVENNIIMVMLSSVENVISGPEQVNDTLEGYESSNNEIKGVNWARSSTAVTLGIWIWSKPFMIKRPTGEQIAVFLLDTQGTADNSHSDKQLDTLIMLISLQLASFQLLNIEKHMRSDELSSLELCADFADIDGDSNHRRSSPSSLFGNLIIVIRDFQDGDVYGEDPGIFQSLEEKLLQLVRVKGFGNCKIFHKNSWMFSNDWEKLCSLLTEFL
ncbi:hypothetical protein EB796_001275 [Bugula neritina]|uniref:Guanylate-binding protein N-terminal domain-containing protein n=1 Tax=Bugula neritina TaxID=10212 RepID=A0A7J7KQQ8_BUGNE|nr:hypothetical protein EB796_001275 [Bugula neritina]